MKIKAYCAFSGAKVLGPGLVNNTVTLMIQPPDNPGLFAKPTAAAGLNLADVAPATITQFVPGGLYTITIEESPAPATS